MRYASCCLVVVMFCAIGSRAGAQVSSQEQNLLAGNTGDVAGLLGAASAPADSARPSSPASSSDPQQAGVQGVFANYNWQAYLGYSFVRFYAAPGITANRNGFNYSMQYFYKAGWFGGDGEFAATFGSYNNYSSKFLMGMGGPRARWSAPRGIELWAHGLVGETHFSPRFAYGSQGAFGYEIGGGIDIDAHHRRLAYRVQADMVGTLFYNTRQYSPKISAGLVYKF
jgi:hypothetical protein